MAFRFLGNETCAGVNDKVGARVSDRCAGSRILTGLLIKECRAERLIYVLRKTDLFSC